MSVAVAERHPVQRARFEALQRERSEPSWLRDRRAEAFARFESLGFPTTRDEAWRDTSVAEIGRGEFAAGDSTIRNAALSATLTRLSFGGAFAGAEIVMVNGRYAPDLSRCDVPGVGVRTLAQAGLDGRLGSVAVDASHPFLALNTALFEDAIFISVTAPVERPIHLIHLATAPAAPAVVHPRLLLVAGRAGQATLVESYGGPSGEVYWTNAVTELVLEDGAVLDHVRLQRESLAAFHVATLSATLGRDARYTNTAITIGGLLSRADIDVVLDAPGAEAALNGLFVADGKQHLDTHSRIDHRRPHGTSREDYKGVLSGQASGVFHGRILVRPGAQKTDAVQSNKNLLLSKDALVNSTPQLEILADDVKCKHGSTTGQLDETALFYLRTRGISMEAARSLLTFAFCSDIASRIRVPQVRDSLEAFLRDRLPEAPREAVA